MNHPILLFLISVALFPCLTANSVEVIGTLQSVNGNPIIGKVTTAQIEPKLLFTTHEVGEDGKFHFTVDSQGEVTIRADAVGCAPVEHVIPAKSSGTKYIDFKLPLAQPVKVQVVDHDGRPVTGAEVRVRYYEPDKPKRRTDTQAGQITDETGSYELQDVGIDVPFVLDIYSPNHIPVTTKVFKLKKGEMELGPINLTSVGATVVVTVDDEGHPIVPGTWVTLLSGPRSLSPDDKRSWVHHRAYTKRTQVSEKKQARFTGVPPGPVEVHLKTYSDASDGIGRVNSILAKKQAIAKANEELRITLTLNK